jgi:hypothetical protein
MQNIVTLLGSLRPNEVWWTWRPPLVGGTVGWWLEDRRYPAPIEDLAPDIVRQRLLVEGYYTLYVDEPAVTRYLTGLAAELDLRTYATPSIFSASGESGSQNQGFDAFLPLVDSGVSLYVWSVQQFLSAVVFSCKRFDRRRAVGFTREYFKMTRLTHEDF